jgi:excisionase family DNA binding protein
MQPDSEVGERLLRAKEVADLLGVTPQVVRKLVAKGSLPRPIRYNRRLVRWKASEIRRWLGEQRPD